MFVPYNYRDGSFNQGKEQEKKHYIATISGAQAPNKAALKTIYKQASYNGMYQPPTMIENKPN